MTTNTRDFPFKRNTSIEPVRVKADGSKVSVPPLPEGSTSFGVDNTYPVYIRLVGTGYGAAQWNQAAEGKGWIFGPGKHGPFSTQFPEFMSAIAVERPGYPVSNAPNAELEVFYGSGTGGWGGAGTPFVTIMNTSIPVTFSGNPSVSVSNFPATQPVSGTVSVSNFPATQAVSGTVSVNTHAVTQSGTWNVGLSAGTNVIGAVTGRGTGSMATGQVAMAANTAVQAVAARPARRSVTLVPTNQNTFFYGNAGVTLTTGAVAPNGVAITLETTAAVFVIADKVNTMTFVENF